MKTLKIVAIVLLIVGGLNWGLYVFDVNLVNILFGSVAFLENAVYLLVAISAVYVGVDLFVNKDVDND